MDLNYDFNEPVDLKSDINEFLKYKHQDKMDISSTVLIQSASTSELETVTTTDDVEELIPSDTSTQHDHYETTTISKCHIAHRHIFILKAQISLAVLYLILYY